MFIPFLRAKQSVFKQSPHLDECEKSIQKTITTIKVSELKLVSIFSREVKFFLRAERRLLGSYSNTDIFKELIYFQKCRHMFTMTSILILTGPLFLHKE